MILLSVLSNSAFSQVPATFAVIGIIEAVNSRALRRCPARELPLLPEQYIKECLKTDSVTDGKWVTTFSVASDLCKKNPWYEFDKREGDLVSYKIRRSKGAFEIKMDVYFTYKGEAKNKKEALEKLEVARQCAVKFYAKNGLSFDLNFQIQTGFKDWITSNASINLYDTFEHSDSGNWATHNDMGSYVTADNLCGTVIHELGHRLGLPDLAKDKDCPDHVIGRINDVMRDSGWRGTRRNRFFPAEIASIIQPLCGNLHPGIFRNFALHPFDTDSD